MNKTISLLIFILALYTFSNSSFALNICYPFNIIISESSWKIEYQDEQIKIESKTINYESIKDGIKHERVVFKYTNLTSKMINISFNRNLIYNGICYGCDKSDKKFLIKLNPKETKEFSEINKDKTFYIFSKDLKGTIKKTLDSFQLTNIEKN